MMNFSIDIMHDLIEDREMRGFFNFPSFLGSRCDIRNDFLKCPIFFINNIDLKEPVEKRKKLKFRHLEVAQTL